MKKLERAKKLMEKETCTKYSGEVLTRELYANGKTGTLVCQIGGFLDSYYHPAGLIVGNERGCEIFNTYPWNRNKTQVTVGKISENTRSVIIPLSWLEDFYGKESEQSDTLRFKKNDFRPYGE